MGRRRSGFAKKIDFVHWTYGSFSKLALSAGTSAVSVFAEQHLPETLLRMRGEIVVYADGAQAPGALASIGCGIRAVPSGTDATVLTSPISQGDAPWIWLGYYMIGHEEGVVDVLALSGLGFVRDVIDSKAMRKLDQNTELQFVVENATVGSAVTVNIAGQVRILTGT